MGRPLTSETAERRIKTRKMDARILNLRLRGLTYRQIADRVGCHYTSVGRSLHKSLGKMEAERIELGRKLVDFELRRIDGVIRTARQAVDQFSNLTVDEKGRASNRAELLDKPLKIILQCVEQRAKLLGLYQPVEVNVTTHEDALKELE